MNEEEIIKRDDEYLKKNKKEIVYNLIQGFPVKRIPQSIFMAGSPGAGKTEVKKAILAFYEESLLDIDPDEMRKYFDEYTGKNAHLFQKHVSTLASELHSKALKKKTGFIFDGTFSNYNKAKENVERSLKRDRLVIINYVHQDPLTAWKFINKRVKETGRAIPKEEFVRKYFGAQEVVGKIKKEFNKKIILNIFLKNTDGTLKEIETDVESIDLFIEKNYTLKSLENNLL